MKSLYGLFQTKGKAHAYHMGLCRRPEMVDFVYADNLSSALDHFICMFHYDGLCISSVFDDGFYLSDSNTLCLVRCLEGLYE